ncbi:MAG: hypothetical protein JNL50_00550 [Phycisphaerae bacterium]|nr:hypothetical protein [Phycisphaerae bacterium]
MSGRRIIAGRVMRVAGVIAAAVMVSGAGAGTGGAGAIGGPPERVLIDRALSRSTVRVTGFAGASVSYVMGEAWPSGTVRTRQLSDVAAIVGAGERPEPARAGTVVVELVDGTRLLGTLEPTGDPDRGEVRGTAIGTVPLGLDHLSRLVFDDGAAGSAGGSGSAPSDSDVVELANGDRLEGLVVSLFPLVVEDVRDAGKKTELSADRVRRVVMSNARREGGHSRVWLRDGSIVNIETFVKGEGGVLAGRASVSGMPVDGPGPSLVVAPERVLALVMSGTELVALSDVAVAAYRPGMGRRWAPGPSVVGGVAGGGVSGGGALGGDIELCGPMTAEWELPKGAARFSAGVELAAGARALGECTLVVEWGGKEIARLELGGERWSGEVVAALEGGPGRLVMRVESGGRGPVQNRVVLRQAMVLMERH